MNSVGSTNLLSKYNRNMQAGQSPYPQSPQLPAGSTVPQTKEQDLIEKQKRLIALQNNEINSLKAQNNSASHGFIPTVLSLIGGVALLNFIFTYKSPQRIKAEVAQAAAAMQEALDNSLRSAFNSETAVQVKEKPKRVIRAILDNVGKVVGKKIFDNENDRLLKVIEYYPGTKKPMTIEAYDYVNGRINYSWFREDSTRAMEEIFDIKTRDKIATFFFEEDGKTVSKVKRS